MKKCAKVFSVILAVMMLASLAACGAEKVKITPTAARSIETEVYETADFSITIPKGWVVTTGGENIYHSIRVYDPEEPMNQMFSLLKADVLLHSQEGKRRGSIWPASAPPALRFLRRPSYWELPPPRAFIRSSPIIPPL